MHTYTHIQLGSWGQGAETTAGRHEKQYNWCASTLCGETCHRLQSICSQHPSQKTDSTRVRFGTVLLQFKVRCNKVKVQNKGAKTRRRSQNSSRDKIKSLLPCHGGREFPQLRRRTFLGNFWAQGDRNLASAAARCAVSLQLMNTERPPPPIKTRKTKLCILREF